MKAILLKIFNLIKDFFTKSKSKRKAIKELNQDKEELVQKKQIRDYVYNREVTFEKEMFNVIEWDKIEDPEIVNPDKQLTLLLVDDIPHTKLLYSNDFENLKEEKNFNVNDHFKIVKCLGENAGFIAYKYAINNKQPVHVGLLDITLGHRIFINGESPKEFDGIDLAIAIVREQPNFNYNFCTAHTLNQDNTTIKSVNRKINNYFDKDLKDVYIAKNGDRLDLLYTIFNKVIKDNENGNN